jgi:hypothetical protein
MHEDFRRLMERVQQRTIADHDLRAEYERIREQAKKDIQAMNSGRESDELRRLSRRFGWLQLAQVGLFLYAILSIVAYFRLELEERWEGFVLLPVPVVAMIVLFNWRKIVR